MLAQQRKEELRIEALVQLRDPLLENIRNDQGEEGGRGDGERKTEVEREEESEEQTDQIFYWDTSASETDTESESDAMDMMTDFEPDSETENQPVKQSRSALGQLQWNRDAGKGLRGAYGSGSRSTHKRERKKVEALESEAKKSCNIVALFNRQRELNLYPPQSRRIPCPQC